MKKKSIGFIGAGNMASAIIKGLISSGTGSVGRILAYDPRVEQLEKLAKEYGVVAASSNIALCKECGVIVLSVKPRQVNDILKEVAGVINENTLLISIAAGVSMFQIENRLKYKVRLARLMPNTPLLVGKGMSALACGSSMVEEDRKFIKEIFGAVGKIIEVKENLMDAITALSGSGPAFVFSFIEGLADGGVKVGLDRSQALLLAAQTVAGAAEMVMTTGLNPGELKDMVTSPGGTTIAGYHVLEQAGFKGTLISAVEAAYLRARQLENE